MATDIVKRAQDALAIAHEKNALTDDIEHQVVPGLRHLLLAAGAKPFTAEDPLLLQMKGMLGVVPAGWQGPLEPCHSRR
jgi:hypothetical protein